MTTEKVSVTLDKDVLRQARKQIRGRGLSAYINEALQRQLQHDRIGKLLQDLDREFGPAADELMEEARAAWPASGAKSKRRRA